MSTGGGSEGRWRRDPAFTLGVPRKLFNMQTMNLGASAQRRYGVTADGQRFLLNVPLAGVTIEPITVTLNWQRALKDR